MAQIEGLNVSYKSNRAAIDALKQRQDKLKVVIKKVDELEETVQENSHAIMEHADAIGDAAKTTNFLMAKVDGAVQEVQKKKPESPVSVRNLEGVNREPARATHEHTIPTANIRQKSGDTCSAERPTPEKRGYGPKTSS